MTAATCHSAIAVTNVNEITLRNIDPAPATVLISATGVISFSGPSLVATHADNAAIAGWEITAQVSASAMVDLFELSEPQDSSTQALRINADADLSPIETPGIITISLSVRTASDEASEDFDIQALSPSAKGITALADSDTATNALPEDAPPSSHTGIILSATNEDPGSTVTYALTDSNDGLFAVDGDSGRVALRGRLNYELSTQHTIIARAMSDDGSSATAAFTVAVINAQEFVLEDTHPDTNTVIAQARASVDGLLLQASHPDVDLSDYRWSLGQQAGLFEFTQNITGSLSQGLRLRQDANPQPYINQTTELSVILRDAGRGERGDLTTLTLTVRIGEAPDIILRPRLTEGMDVVAEGDATTLTLTVSPAQTDTLTFSFSAEGESSGLIAFHPNPAILAPSATTIMTEIRIAADNIITAKDRAVIVRYVASGTNRVSLVAGSGAGDLKVTPAQADSNESIQGSIPLIIRADDPAQLIVQPTTLTIGEGDTRHVRIDVAELMRVLPANGDSAAYPTMAEPLTITATAQGEGQGQLSAEPPAVGYAAGEQLRASTLSVTAIDDTREEDETSYTIALIVRGHAEFARNEITVTVPANDPPVANLRDIDDAPDEVAENSGSNTPVGITIRADNATTYTLSDDAGGRFAINGDGLVTVADGGKLNFEDAATHSITVEVSNEVNSQSTRLTISVANVNEITLRDRDARNNVVVASTGAAVRGMTLEAVHDDGATAIVWELRQESDVFELTQSAGSSTQGLRIKDDAESLSSHIGATTELSVIARAEYDAATMTSTIRFTEQEIELVGIMDIDSADNEVAENSPANTPVGITIKVDNATTYTLSDDAEGRFAISAETTGLVTVADGANLNFEDAASHSIIAQASNASDTLNVRFTIDVINVDEITLEDTDNADNTVLASANAVVEGLELRATHADDAPIMSWEIAAQTVDSSPSTIVDLFEFSEPQDSATRTLRIKADANINSIEKPSTVTLSISVRTAFDEAGEDFDIQVLSPQPEGIRLRVRVYLEGALE